MCEFIKSFVVGMGIGFKWQLIQIKRNKWYIILVIIDIVLIPLKLVLLIPTMTIKCGRKIVFQMSDEMSKEVIEYEEG